jgi:hypothetical protein
MQRLRRVSSSPSLRPRKYSWPCHGKFQANKHLSLATSQRPVGTSAISVKSTDYSHALHHYSQYCSKEAFPFVLRVRRQQFWYLFSLTEIQLFVSRSLLFWLRFLFVWRQHSSEDCICSFDSSRVSMRLARSCSFFNGLSQLNSLTQDKKMYYRKRDSDTLCLMWCLVIKPLLWQNSHKRRLLRIAKINIVYSLALPKGYSRHTDFTQVAQMKKRRRGTGEKIVTILNLTLCVFLSSK